MRKILFWAGGLILWGLFIGIGFWISHLITGSVEGGVKRWKEQRDIKRASDKVAAEMEAEGTF